MKRVAAFIFLLALMLPAAAQAQQVGNTAQGSLLQSGGGGLQQAPAGLQGSDPQIFGDSSKGSLLDQSNQKLLNDAGLSANTGSGQMDKQPDKAIPPDTAGGTSKTLLAGICLFLAGIGALLWFWLRRLEIS